MIDKELTVRQNEELRKVKAKIKALLAMTVDRGASETEANFAMAQVGKLLTQYQMSMEEIDVAAENCIKVSVGAGTKKRSLHSVFTYTIARFCGVMVWSHSTSKEMTYVFFGLEPDVEMAVYLFNVINTAIKNATNEFKQTPQYRFAEVHRKRLSTSFQNGMAERIRSRLVDLTFEQMNQRKKHTGTSTDLVVVAKDRRIDSEFKKTGVKLRNISVGTRITSPSSASAGALAGDRVNLNRPIHGKNGPLMITKG